MNTSVSCTSVSRRSFIAGAAGLGALCLAGAAGQAPLGARAAEAADPASAADECDILVIGGGISASIAALSALKEGAGSVILCEKQSFIGGSARLSSGFMVTVENDHFDESIDDSWEKMSEVLHGVHDQSPDTTYPNWDRLEATFAAQSATIDFMADDLGMTAEYGEKSTAVTMWDGSGSGMMDALDEAMQTRGVDIRLDTPAKSLVTDESGAVCGAVVEDKNGAYTISAKKVILACGGAAHNTELFSEWQPTCTNIDFDNDANAGNTGDGFVMGREIGAKLYDTMVYEGGGYSVDDDWKLETSVRISTSDKMLVDAEGLRFTNEAPTGSGSSQMLTYYMVVNGSEGYYFIFDAATADEDTRAKFDTGVEMGAVLYGETIEALADAMGAPALVDTYATYQAACESGVDDEQGKAAESLLAYDDSEGLYAIYVRPTLWGTIGGIETDLDYHALNEDGEVIPNLFAVGEMSNREMFSCFYVGGNSLALSSTMGRLAGINAVDEL